MVLNKKELNELRKSLDKIMGDDMHSEELDSLAFYISHYPDILNRSIETLKLDDEFDVEIIEMIEKFNELNKELR